MGHPNYAAQQYAAAQNQLQAARLPSHLQQALNSPVVQPDPIRQLLDLVTMHLVPQILALRGEIAVLRDELRGSRLRCEALMARLPGPAAAVPAMPANALRHSR